jgi:hypothetical protein
MLANSILPEGRQIAVSPVSLTATLKKMSRTEASEHSPPELTGSLAQEKDMTS